MQNIKKIIKIFNKKYSLITILLMIIISFNVKASAVIGKAVSPNSSEAPKYAGAGYVGGTNYVFSYDEAAGVYTATKLLNTYVVPARGWEKINADGYDNWYYFDEQTLALKTSWFIYNGETFYAYAVNDGNIGKVYAGWHEIDGMVYYFNETTCVLAQTYTMEQAYARKIITPEQMARENLKALIKSNEAENKAALKTKNKKEESKPTKETEGHKESDTKQESKKQELSDKKEETKSKETSNKKQEDKKQESKKQDESKLGIDDARITESTKDSHAIEGRIDNPTEHDKSIENRTKANHNAGLTIDGIVASIRSIIEWIYNLFQ